MSRPRVLFVAGAGGPPLDYVLPRIARHAELVTFRAVELPASRLAALEGHSTRVIANPVRDPRSTAADLAEALVGAARSSRAQGLVVVDETCLLPAAEAARVLGLPGPGPHAVRARNKWLMREAFTAGGVPSPLCRRVPDEESLRRAGDELGFPFLLKVTEGVGSFALATVTNPEHARAEWRSLTRAVEAAATTERFRYVDSFRAPEFIAERLIHGAAAAWYDTPGYGDFVSVEGFVVGGRYHPIALTARTPTAPPFTEVGFLTPCVLPPPRQAMITATARRAVDALGLETCGTHTEIKLLPNDDLCVVESAARIPSGPIPRQLERAFGVDLVGRLTRLAIDADAAHVPSFVGPDDARCAAGAVGILTLDRHGRPWNALPRFSRDVDWGSAVEPGVRIDVEWSPRYEPGDRLVPYDPARGSQNYLGSVFLECGTADVLLRNQYAIIDNAERLMRRAAPLRQPVVEFG